MIPSMSRAHTLTVGEALLWLETVQRCYGPAVPLCFVQGPPPPYGRLWLPRLAHPQGGLVLAALLSMQTTEETGSPLVLLYETPPPGDVYDHDHPGSPAAGAL